MRGDTITAHFDSVQAPGDTSSQPQMRQLISQGSAQSFYQLAAKDSGVVGPAINYVKGRDISIAFANRVVQTVNVVDQAQGRLPRATGAWAGRHAQGATASHTVHAPSGEATVIERQLPLPVQRFIEEHARGDRWTAMALHALICAARDDGQVLFNDIAIQYRNDYLGMVRDEGRDADREAGRLGLDEVREHLVRTVLPRLAQDGLVTLPAGQIGSDTTITIEPSYWSQLAPFRQAIQDSGVEGVLKHTGEHAVVRAGGRLPTEPLEGGSILEARSLVKTYKRRRVVNDVALRLQQGEIVGLLGPNGAGKTTTFYMIVGLDTTAGRSNSPRQSRHYGDADVPARAPGHRLPFSGTLDLS